MIPQTHFFFSLSMPDVKQHFFLLMAVGNERDNFLLASAPVINIERPKETRCGRQKYVLPLHFVYFAYEDSRLANSR